MIAGANAQILIGPVAGGHISWTRFEEREVRDEYKSSPLFRYHAGATLTFNVRKRFFLHASLIYARKGKLIQSYTDPVLYNKVIYNHIDLPVLYTVEFKAKIGTNKIFKWYLGGGPNISYWASGRGVFRSSEISEFGIDQIDYTVAFRKAPEETAINELAVEEPNRLQLGFNLAAGTAFEPAGFNKVMITLRYEIGHSFLGRTNGFFDRVLEFSDILRARNSGLHISVAYLIDLKMDQRKKGKSTINKRKL